MIIKPTYKDIFKIEELIRVAAQEGPYKELSYNREKVLLGIKDILEDPSQCIIIYTIKDKFIGIFLGYLSTWYTGDDIVAQDKTWFVLPEYRTKTRAAIVLVKAFEKWAKDNGAMSICPGSMTGGDIDVVCKLYERLGYKAIGYNFKKTIKV